MLYYSEKLEELFENEESLKTAELEYDEKQKEKERIEKDKKVEKKRLAKLIEDAEADIDKARDELVKVNGEICVQRGKKLYKGDIVEFNGESYKVV